jgi:hypothetical protein
MSHLSHEELIDLAEGARPESSAPHLASCAACRGQLADTRAMLAAAAEVDLVEIPEPSPLFWDHLSARVSEAVAAEHAPDASRAGSFVRHAAAWLLPAIAVAAVTIAIAVVGNLRETKPGQPAGVIWQAEASSGFDDPSLVLVADLAAGMDQDAQAEAGLTTRVGAADKVVAELNDGERAELGRLIKDAMAHRAN